jgi:hypothetical protein
MVVRALFAPTCWASSWSWTIGRHQGGQMLPRVRVANRTARYWPASESGCQGRNLPVDQRPELTIILHMGGISMQGQYVTRTSGGTSPWPSDRETS